MMRIESIEKLEKMIKKVEQYQKELILKFPEYETDMERRGFIDYCQFIKSTWLAKIEQYKNMSDEGFYDLYLNSVDATLKSIEIHFKTLMNSKNTKFTPRDPNKNIPIR